MAAPIRPRCSTPRRPTSQNNPQTVQALANAFVRGLRWIAANPPEEIADLMPAEYALGNTDNLHPLDPQQHADVFAGRHDSSARPPRPRTRCCASSTRTCSRPTIDLAATYTNAFVAKVPPR